jgi:hypothetical protein
VFDTGIQFWKYWGEKLLPAKNYSVREPRKPYNALKGKSRKPTRMVKVLVIHPDGREETTVNLRQFLISRFSDFAESLYWRALRTSEVRGYRFVKLGYIRARFNGETHEHAIADN